MIIDLSEEKHKKFRYSKSLPVYMSFDFNKKWTVLIKQIHGNTKVYLEGIRDFPENLIPDLALKYGSYEVIITGDSNGRGQTQYTSDVSKKTAWLLFKSEFNRYCCEFYGRPLQMQQNAYFNDSFVPSANIGQDASRTLINAMIFEWGKNNDIYFDENGCRDLIAEFKTIGANEYGGLEKDDLNRKDIGHITDCFRYDISYFHFREFRKMGIYTEVAEKYKRLDK